MPLTEAIIKEIDRHYPNLDDARRGAELVRELISYMIGAVMSEAGRRLAAAKPQSAHDVRHHHQPLVAFPPEVAEEEAAIKAFLKQHMYRHPRVMRVMGEAEGILFDLFARYQSLPGRPAGRMGRGVRARERRRTGPPDRQFHRRNDRPFRLNRAPKAF